MLERINNNNDLLAIIIYRNYLCTGIEFLTPDEASMQVGVMCHPQGHKILPHLHVPSERSIKDTQEVIFIRKGKARVDFYDDDKIYLKSRTIDAGDVILLISGGHGFTVLEDIEMIEAKTGPFMGESDKVKFIPHS